nr:RNA cytidine acetyltransferase 1 [Ipomoea batatas]
MAQHGAVVTPEAAKDILYVGNQSMTAFELYMWTKFSHLCEDHERLQVMLYLKFARRNVCVKSYKGHMGILSKIGVGHLELLDKCSDGACQEHDSLVQVCKNADCVLDPKINFAEVDSSDGFLESIDGIFSPHDMKRLEAYTNNLVDLQSVKNPLEGNEVVGITNYTDFDFELRSRYS